MGFDPATNFTTFKSLENYTGETVTFLGSTKTMGEWAVIMTDILDSQSPDPYTGRVDFGPDGVNGGTDDTRQQLFVRKTPSIVADSWMTIEFSLNSLTNRANVGLLIFENINFSSLTNLHLDNIYFYK